MILNRIIKFIKSKTTPIETLAREAGVDIGYNNFISSPFWGTEPYLIKVGSNCQITEGVKMFTHGGAQVLRDQDPDFDTFGKVVIGDWVYIGNNSLIMPGVTIGDHVLIAAGSVVTKSVRSGSVVGGNPARFICTIEEYRSKNERFNTKTKAYTAGEKRKRLLSLSEDMFISKPYIKNEK